MELQEFRLNYFQFEHFFKDEQTSLNYLGGLVHLKNVTEARGRDEEEIKNFKDEALRLHLLFLKIDLIYQTE